jgi:hypothetical protein
MARRGCDHSCDLAAINQTWEQRSLEPKRRGIVCAKDDASESSRAAYWPNLGQKARSHGFVGLQIVDLVGVPGPTMMSTMSTL